MGVIQPPSLDQISQEATPQLDLLGQSIKQTNKQTSIAPISTVKPDSVARQPNQCLTAKSRKQFRNINRPWGMTLSMGERPSQGDVSSDIS